MNSQELVFVFFCVESIATKLGKRARDVYDTLSKSGLIDSYIVPSYDVLHTQGKDYIVNDILSVAQEKGIKL